MQHKITGFRILHFSVPFTTHCLASLYPYLFLSLSLCLSLSQSSCSVMQYLWPSGPSYSFLCAFNHAHVCINTQTHTRTYTHTYTAWLCLQLAFYSPHICSTYSVDSFIALCIASLFLCASRLPTLRHLTNIKVSSILAEGSSLRGL